VRIHTDGSDPTLASRVANTWAQTFISTNLERRFEASSYAKTFLEQQLAKTKEKLEESELLFNQYTRQKQIINVDEKTNLVAQNLQEFTGAVAKAEQERIKAEANYAETKRNLQNSRELLESKTLGSFREAKAKLEAEYQDQLKIYKPGFPKMQQIQSQIDELDKRIKSESKTVTDSIEGTARAAFDAAKTQESQLRARADAARRSVLELDSYRDHLAVDAPLRVFVEQMKHGQARETIDYNRIAINQTIAEAVEKCLAGGMEPKQALDEAAAKANRLLQP